MRLDQATESHLFNFIANIAARDADEAIEMYTAVTGFIDDLDEDDLRHHLSIGWSRVLDLAGAYECRTRDASEQKEVK